MLFIDCPVGYFGESCTDKCTPPIYGELHVCSDGCDCTLCHHIFGWNETGETTGKTFKNKDF